MSLHRSRRPSRPPRVLDFDLLFSTLFKFIYFEDLCLELRMLPGPGEAEFKAQVILTNHPFIYKFDDLYLVSASLNFEATRRGHASSICSL